MNASSTNTAEPQTVHPIKGRKVLVLGLGHTGQAACTLLVRKGAKVTALEEADRPPAEETARALAAQGVSIRLGAKGLPRSSFHLAVTSPRIPPAHRWLQALEKRGTPIISELELGYQNSYCLNVAVTGTNGKTTTTGLIEQILTQNQLHTRVAGISGVPVSSVAEASRELDFLVLETNCFQLDRTCYFRPAVAVVLNITSDHMDRFGCMNNYILAKAKIFKNQQPFDWAIVQSEVLAQLRTLQVPIQSKIITFSAYNRRADLYLERGLLISRLPGWTGPLLDLDRCRLRGPHNAENLMAALAVGRVLRIALESMKEPLQQFAAPAHRCEVMAQIGGVTYVNDSKSTNVDSLHKALLTMPPGPGTEPNVWVLAGGREKGADYHDVGPLLSQRVKGAFLFGEAREQLRAAWSLFTPCTMVQSLLEALQEAARLAVAGDVILLSPACSSLDQFESYQQRGEVFRSAVQERARKGRASSSSEESSQDA